MRRTDWDDRGGDPHRIGDQLVDAHGRVGDAVDEGTVGAVFEQPPDQIGEQRAMRADRRIDAARPVEIVLANHRRIERLAHAVEALELVLAGPEVAAGHFIHSGQRLGVVGGELRKDFGGCREQLFRRRQIRDVRMHLAGEHRVVVEAVDLRLLDLTVPIGALDQPHHQPVAAAMAEIDQPVGDCRAALAIGLDDEADAVPTAEIGIEGQRLEQIERDVEPVRLLGIDVEADIVLLGEQREALKPRQQFIPDPINLGAAITRMERGELDGNARTEQGAAAGRGGADRLDRHAVRL